MAKFKSVKFNGKSSLFKTFGLLALILFTFYFIYNYLATGSFSLKPRAGEIVVSDVNSCSQLLTDVDCNRLKDRGCSWVVGPSTTKTENVPQVTTVPVTNYLQVDCTDNDCSSGRHGCSYTTTSKTVNQTQVQAVYECDDGSGVSQSKCIQLGGAWVKTGTKTVTVPVTTTTKSCNGSWENPVTTQQSVTTYTTKVVQVPGVGSCTGTLKPLVTSPTVKPPVVDGNPRVVNSVVTTPKPVSDTNKRYKCGYGFGRVYYRNSNYKTVTVEKVDRNLVCNTYTRTQDGCTAQEKKDGMWRMCEPYDQCNNYGKYGACDIDTQLSLDINASSKYKNIVCDPTNSNDPSHGNDTCFKATGDTHYRCGEWAYVGRCIYIR